MHTVHFYRTPAGRTVIQEWLRDFDKPDRAILGFDLKRVQLGFPMDFRSAAPSGTGCGKSDPA